MDPDTIQRRLRRIEGQIQGVQRMLAEDRACEDLLTQMLAIRAAVEQASLLMTEKHVRACGLGGSEASEAQVAALMEVLNLWLRAGGPAAEPAGEDA